MYTILFSHPKNKERYDKIVNELKNKLMGTFGVDYQNSVIKSGSGVINSLPVTWMDEKSKSDFNYIWGKFLEDMEEWIIKNPKDMEYSNDAKEVYPFFLGIRYVLQIKPNESVTKEQIINLVKTTFNSDLTKINPNIAYFLAYWVYQGYPPLEEILNDLNKLTMGVPVKKVSPTDLPFLPKTEYA